VFLAVGKILIISAYPVWQWFCKVKMRQVKYIFIWGGQKMKLNCWETKKCGRETGGAFAKSMGVCPAAVDRRLHGIHGGKNAGRACWVVAGTLCGGEVQGTFGAKFKSCEQCDFYQKTKAEEKSDFTLSIVLLSRLKSGAPEAVPCNS